MGLGGRLTLVFWGWGEEWCCAFCGLLGCRFWVGLLWFGDETTGLYLGWV